MKSGKGTGDKLSQASKRGVKAGSDQKARIEHLCQATAVMTSFRPCCQRGHTRICFCHLCLWCHSCSAGYNDLIFGSLLSLSVSNSFVRHRRHSQSPLSANVARGSQVAELANLIKISMSEIPSFEAKAGTNPIPALHHSIQHFFDWEIINLRFIKSYQGQVAHGVWDWQRCANKFEQRHQTSERSEKSNTLEPGKQILLRQKSKASSTRNAVSTKVRFNNNNYSYFYHFTVISMLNDNCNTISIPLHSDASPRDRLRHAIQPLHTYV